MLASQTAQIVRGTLILLALVLIVGWFVWTTIKRADDPARMVFKWILTVVILGFMIKVVAPLVGKGGYVGAFGGIPMTAVCSLALAFVWRHNLASLVAQPFASLYDGGGTPV